MHRYTTHKIFCFLFFLGLLSSKLPAQAPGNDSTHFDRLAVYKTDNLKQSALDLLVDSVVKGFMQNPQHSGLSLAITRNGTTNFYNYGELKRGNGLLPDKNSIYEIGALSASFCGALLAKAVSEKKVSLEDEVTKYLPGMYKNLVFGRTSIRLKHLASHTSGLPQLPDDLMQQANFDAADPYKNYSREQLLASLARIKLQSEPGAVYDYSSLGIAVLGMILEKVYALPYEILLKEKIIVPAQLENTALTLSVEQAGHFAEGHRADGEKTAYWHMDAFTPAGGLKSTSQDLCGYITPFFQENEKKLALSWLIKKTKQGNTLCYQTGGTYGFGAFMGFVKEKQCSVVVLANTAESMDHIALSLLNYLQ